MLLTSKNDAGKIRKMMMMGEIGCLVVVLTCSYGVCKSSQKCRSKVLRTCHHDKREKRLDPLEKE